MAEVTCSFCGRSKKDVDLMISGIHAHICDKCVTQANQILGEEKKSKNEAGFSPNFKLIKPLEIKKFLDEYVMCSSKSLTSSWPAKPELARPTLPVRWQNFCKYHFVSLMLPF
jgi:hypothetical protein